jgi:hypothetical protein
MVLGALFVALTHLLVRLNHISPETIEDMGGVSGLRR